MTRLHVISAAVTIISYIRDLKLTSEFSNDLTNVRVAFHSTFSTQTLSWFEHVHIHVYFHVLILKQLLNTVFTLLNTKAELEM